MPTSSKATLRCNAGVQVSSSQVLTSDLRKVLGEILREFGDGDVAILLRS